MSVTQTGCGHQEGKYMLIRKADDVRSSEITPKNVVLNRRAFLAGAAALGAGAVVTNRISSMIHPGTVAFADTKLKTVESNYKLAETQTPLAKMSSYNNFYEFGTDKSDPSRNAHTLHTRPWTVQVTGMVKKPQTVNIDDLMSYRPLESRVYRHRCVEAWSMVIPWDGYSLSEFINFCQPLPSAKFVQFFSLVDKKQMPNLPGGYDWPYSEGLRMDEAMNPLCLLTFGCYGDVLPNQNGAPVRVITPWKYGFKNGKSIVRFHFADKMPKTTWNEINAEEYGFYSNVNPTVNHPRWSQAHERRIDASAFPRTIPTLPFNGYANQVASIYNGMDLRKNF
jgi:sulfoxide reductase catalytic subunit YedY